MSEAGKKLTLGGGSLVFEAGREPVIPRPAATVVIVRAEAGRLEVFCVQRHVKSGFLGGAVVFPGGKLDLGDADEAFLRLARGVPARSEGFTTSVDEARALAVAAARETLEEAGVAPIEGGDPNASAVSAQRMRAALAAGRSFASALDDEGLVLDLAAFVPFARWITPEAEARRFDARLYLLALPPGQIARCDGHETTIGFWAPPAEVLRRFKAGEIQLAPPTTRTLEILGRARDWDAIVAIAREQSLLPVCPQFVPGDPPALALPGDRSHDVKEKRVEGATRFVLREGKFVSEDPA